MAVEKFTERLAVARRRTALLAVLRGVIGLGYLFLQTVEWARSGAWTGIAAATAMSAYAGAMLLYQSRPESLRATRAVLAADTAIMIASVVFTAGGELAIPLTMFYFLVVQAALLHGPREVLLVSSLGIALFSAWAAGAESGEFRFSFGSFFFLLAVGGALGYYFADQAQRAEQRIAALLRRAAGRPEAEMVAPIEEALGELARAFGCARALLAFWERDSDYYALCQHPPERGVSDTPPVHFDIRQEWAGFAGSRLDFHASDVSLTDAEGRKIDRPFDLHPFAIQRFEIYNALGAGLRDGCEDRPVGRILLVNGVGGISAKRQERLAALARLFAEPVRHLLVVRRTEQEAYERERIRIAHDLHDGPLQSVISFEMRLQIIRRLRERDPDRADRELASLYELSRSLVQEMRTFVHRMRPIEADELSLGSSMRRLIEGFQKESGVAVTMLGEADSRWRLPPRTTSETLKIAREALHNIYKHSRATHVLVSMEKSGAELRLGIDDNGTGFDFGGRFDLDELESLQLGPRTIKQRVRGLGGQLTIESNPGHGASLRLKLPLGGGET